jgi:phytoene dehydrogenase-like protein
MSKAGNTEYDAVVVGSGPNGLAAGITLLQQGLSVLLLEARGEIGGGMRSAGLTLPGFVHDVCSAIHPMAANSPFFSSLPLEAHGLEYIYPPISAAHPFDDGTAAVLAGTVNDTARLLSLDEGAYIRLMDPLVRTWPLIAPDVLGPLHYPKHPFLMTAFGLKALASASRLAGRWRTEAARGLWSGMAAHSMLPLTEPATAAIGLVLMISGHLKGWPLPKGGTASLGKALASYFTSLGGKIATNVEVKSLDQVPSSRALLLDLTPRQLLRLGGHRWSSSYRSQLSRYRYGMGVFKLDWALDGPIPFLADECRRAGTVHIGGRLEEIVAAEQTVWDGQHAERPFILLAQQSLFDATRAPRGKHTAWAYCHVPNGSTKDMTEVMENQIERFAPGFKERILARHVMNTEQLESYNANYIGGDINGGAIDWRQLFTRPALRSSPYRTSEKGIYICSASTPPGGGVHGMCGYYAAKRAWKDLFERR